MGDKLNDMWNVVYHLVPTSNHNFRPFHLFPPFVVYHLVPTSNHNKGGGECMHWAVVYHLVPTSNHNYDASQRAILGVVYHLVPTSNHNLVVRMHLCQDSCLSSCSYIKPQPRMSIRLSKIRCLSSCSYIKPQLCCLNSWMISVVYHLVPTSNHN